MNPLRSVSDLGQSIWLDYIRRDLLLTGGLHRLVVEDGLGGVTSNPAIFEKAIASSPLYADAVRALLDQGDADAGQLFDAIAVRDVQDACDVLRPVYDKTEGADGFVSIEVSPYLAKDGAATLNEARRLKRLVGRPNLLVKIPATPEGIPAIRDALSEGISINITLLFARDAYEKVAHAYIDGLETFAKKGGDVSRVASVASFFISRIDSLADAQIQKKIAGGAGAAAASGADKARLVELLGRVAIANGRLTYRLYKEIFSGPRWEALAARGARTQRVLWASTSTKNPAYRDVVYVEELIGKDTVNTLPPATLDAMRDHGKPRLSIEEDLAGAETTLADLEKSGLSMKAITDQVLDEGVRLFSDAFDTLLGAVEKKRREILAAPPAPMTLRLPEAMDAALKTALDEQRKTGAVRRLWHYDASLWTNSGEARWLGWRSMPGRMRRNPAPLDEIKELARRGEFTHCLLIGMGGSSLAPDVMVHTWKKLDRYPQLVVLDSTDPAQIRSAFARVDLKTTLVIVSSKSGSTLEPNILMALALEKMRAAVGPAEAPRRFIAITDPGSSLEKEAIAAGFLRVEQGDPTIGGRYSALSPFGMVPAAVMGLDTHHLLDRALTMARSCADSVPPAENPGFILGTLLGTAAKAGRDKLTIVASHEIAAIGGWIEQLIAESTGKQGRGIIPIDGERVGAPAEYGDDRLFVYLRLGYGFDATHDRAMEALAEAGQPVVRIDVATYDDLAGEFFRWEIATAVAGSILGINPFDQPDVEASKVATRTLTDAAERDGRLPAETPFAEADGLKFYADAANAKAIMAAAGGGKPTAAAILAAHFGRLKPGDYAAVLAYLDMNAKHQEALQSIRHRVRAARHVATCLGFGPRFLHSTGQAYKGGPASGVFLQVTCDDAEDLPIPGRKATFGLLKAAQARGDFEVLAERGRRALRVHLGADVGAGLAALGRAVEAALAQGAETGTRRRA